MKRVLLVVVLAGLIAGLAQAQTPQVRLLWERSISDKFYGCVLETTDTLNPRVLMWGHRDRYVIDNGGRITATPFTPPWEGGEPQTKTYIAGLKMVSRSGRFVVWNFYTGDQFEAPWRFNVCDRDGHLLFKQSRKVVRAVSEVGPFFAATSGRQPYLTMPFGDTVFLYDTRGVQVRALAVPLSDRVVFSPDGKRVVIRCQPPRERPGSDPVPVGDIVVFNQEGRKLWETHQAKISAFSVSDSGRVIALTKRSDGVWAVFYDLDGSKKGEVRLNERKDYLAGEYPERKLNVSSDGKKVVVCDGSVLKILASGPVRFVGQFNPGLSNGEFHSAVFDPRNRGIWTVFSGPWQDTSRIYLLSHEGRVLWEHINPRPFSEIASGGSHLVFTGKVAVWSDTTIGGRVLRNRRLPDKTFVTLFEVK